MPAPMAALKSFLSRAKHHSDQGADGPAYWSKNPGLGDGNGFGHVQDVKGLFPKTDPEVDGEDCLHDCASCSVRYPAKFKIEESDKLYGHVKGWEAHLVVGTGKTDWTRNVEDEKGSIMEAVDHSSIKPANGKLKLSASNLPLPHDSPHPSATTCLLLPSFTLVDNVTPANVPGLIQHMNSSSLISSPVPKGSNIPSASEPPREIAGAGGAEPTMHLRDCPHDYLILLCSQKTRDARCGQSAPLLRKELERHLRPRGLYRDLHDERPGGVGIYFISHVGGHKYSANVIVYRRVGTPGADAPVSEVNGNGEIVGTVKDAENGVKESEEKTEEPKPAREAGQCIWLARVKPEDCENLIRYTILQGKVLKPETQLRGGFDRCRGIASW